MFGWVAAVDFKGSIGGCAVQPRTNSGKLEKLDNGVVIGVVANGVELAVLGHLRARMSVHASLAMLRQDSVSLSKMFIGTARPGLEALFAEVREEVGKAIDLSVLNERRVASDYAASLTAFFVCTFGLAAMQVGKACCWFIGLLEVITAWCSECLIFRMIGNTLGSLMRYRVCASIICGVPSNFCV